MTPFMNPAWLKKILILFFIISVFSHPFIPASAKAAEPSKDRFLSEIRSALKKKSEKSFKQLFNWEGVNDKAKETLNKYLFKNLFDEEVENILFVPLPADFPSEYVLQGIRHYPNLKILGFVQIKYKKGKQGITSTKIPYGKKGNRYFFAGTIQETVQANAPPSKQIQIIIIGLGHPPVTFEGYMLYLQGEIPRRKNLKDLGGGNLTQIVRGEDITFLKVRRTSKKGTIQVQILIDGKTIFETQPTDTDQPIIFKK